MSQNSEFTNYIANLLTIDPQEAVKNWPTFAHYIGNGSTVLGMLGLTFQNDRQTMVDATNFHSALLAAFTSQVKEVGARVMTEGKVTRVLSNAAVALRDANLARAFEDAIGSLAFEMRSYPEEASYHPHSAQEILGQLCYFGNDDDDDEEVSYVMCESGESVASFTYFLEQLSKHVDKLQQTAASVRELDLGAWGSQPVRMFILGGAGTGKTRLVERITERMMKGVSTTVVYDIRPVHGSTGSEIIESCGDCRGRNTCLVTETVQPTYATKVLPLCAPYSHVLVTSHSDWAVKKDGWALGVMIGSSVTVLERAFKTVFCDFFASFAAFTDCLKSFDVIRGTCLFAFQGKLHVWHGYKQDTLPAGETSIAEQPKAIISSSSATLWHASEPADVYVGDVKVSAALSEATMAAASAPPVEPYHCPVAKFSNLGCDGIFHLAPSSPKVSIQLMKFYFSLRDGLCKGDMVSLHDCPWHEESKSQSTICRIVELPSPKCNAFVMQKLAVIDALQPHAL